MADAVDSKSTAFTGMTVQVRPPAPPLPHSLESGSVILRYSLASLSLISIIANRF